jgi:hypothetical protein
MNQVYFGGRRTGDVGRYTETRQEVREMENGCGHG